MEGSIKDSWNMERNMALQHSTLFQMETSSWVDLKKISLLKESMKIKMVKGMKELLKMDK